MSKRLGGIIGCKNKTSSSSWHLNSYSGYSYMYYDWQPAPVAQRYHVTSDTWDVSSIPANGIFLTEKLKNETKNAQRVKND